mmetsp:Transcript_66351/g.181996  ORF Transcript_66351/g.181996 Transcript_66351/m.181996 type:complete len:363 (+) Transcript_66351:215-1303(+)
MVLALLSLARERLGWQRVWPCRLVVDCEVEAPGAVGVRARAKTVPGRLGHVCEADVGDERHEGVARHQRLAVVANAEADTAGHRDVLEREPIDVAAAPHRRLEVDATLTLQHGVAIRDVAQPPTHLRADGEAAPPSLGARDVADEDVLRRDPEVEAKPVEARLDAHAVVRVLDPHVLDQRIPAAVEVDAVRVADAIHRGQDAQPPDVDVLGVGGDERPERRVLEGQCARRRDCWLRRRRPSAGSEHTEPRHVLRLDELRAAGDLTKDGVVAGRVVACGAVLPPGLALTVEHPAAGEGHVGSVVRANHRRVAQRAHNNLVRRRARREAVLVVAPAVAHQRRDERVVVPVCRREQRPIDPQHLV